MPPGEQELWKEQQGFPLSRCGCDSGFKELWKWRYCWQHSTQLHWAGSQEPDQCLHPFSTHWSHNCVLTAKHPFSTRGASNGERDNLEMWRGLQWGAAAEPKGEGMEESHHNEAGLLEEGVQGVGMQAKDTEWGQPHRLLGVSQSPSTTREDLTSWKKTSPCIVRSVHLPQLEGEGRGGERSINTPYILQEKKRSRRCVTESSLQVTLGLCLLLPMLPTLLLPFLPPSKNKTAPLPPPFLSPRRFSGVSTPSCSKTIFRNS